MLAVHEPLKRGGQLCSACFLGARLGGLRDRTTRRAFCISGNGRSLGGPGECSRGVCRHSVGGEVRRDSVSCIRRCEGDFGDTGARGGRRDSRGSTADIENAYGVAHESTTKDGDGSQTNGGHIVEFGGETTVALVQVACNNLGLGCNDLICGGHL